MSDQINCHGDTTHGGIFKYPLPEWQEPNLNPEMGNIETYRRCSYCGSINLHDLLDFIREGHRITFDRTDNWSWDGKFYVHGIPNPDYGNERVMGRGSTWNKETQQYETKDIMGVASREQFAKVKMIHAADLNDDDLQELSDYFWKVSGIYWFRKDGKLCYSIPKPNQGEEALGIGDS